LFFQRQIFDKGTDAGGRNGTIPSLELTFALEPGGGCPPRKRGVWSVVAAK
jgi:hypothetical protein